MELEGRPGLLGRNVDVFVVTNQYAYKIDWLPFSFYVCLVWSGILGRCGGLGSVVG